MTASNLDALSPGVGSLPTLSYGKGNSPIVHLDMFVIEF